MHVNAVMPNRPSFITQGTLYQGEDFENDAKVLSFIPLMVISQI
jgi:hypothetical protein